MSSHKQNPSLSEQLLNATGVKSAKCYQCGKCSAGCPVSTQMEYPPSITMRLIQTEDPKNDTKLLKSETIWLCVSCEMCLSRCPMEIDIPKVMDFMRQKSLEEGLANPKSKNIISFHKAFLDSIKFTGRLHEISLVADYKMRSMHLTQDLMMVPKMLSRGKLPILPETIKGKKQVSGFFKKTKNKNS
ncbi:MAG: 4Fe-4S dicluster domain-containing protein [Bacteroidota bacterium]